MSQTSVARHYQFRKRNIQQVEVLKPTQDIVLGDSDTRTGKEKGEKSTKETISKTVPETSKSQKSEVSKSITKKKTAPAKKVKTTSINKKSSKGKQSTLKGFFTSESDLSKNTTSKTVPAKCFSCVTQQRVSSPFNLTETLTGKSLQQSPKRCPSNLSEEGTPSKKRLLEENLASASKDETVDKPKETARRKLQLESHSSESVSKVPTPKGTNKLDALIDQSRLKLISTPKLGELKQALHSFSEKTLKLKKLQSNPYMINCIASSDKTLQKKKPIPSVLACEKFSHLSETDSLALPLKYKELSDMFRSMDSLVAQMYNRKENATFGAVKEGMETITKRNFSKTHLGQMVTVFPSAYNFSVEKASCISKGSNSSEYQLVIMPNLIIIGGSKKKTFAFHPINPMQLTCRASEFNNKLLDVVKNHHQEFLKKINFATLSKDNIKRWHPKFPVDLVPDIPVSQLPELPQPKMSTAKDVLNKVKGSFRSKVGKPSRNVTEETESSSVKLESKHKDLNSPDLKGICVDLLEKIRGKESALLLTNTIETPEEKKELGMLEKVPKLVNIIYIYFIAERKPAIHIDLVVDKIIHSLSSLSTPEEVKEDLKFIQEKFPFWLNFVQCSKGVYVTVNKSVHISQMLENAGLH